MIKKGFIWAVFAGALFLAQPHIAYAQSLPGPAPTGCYLTAHGDVQCPADPEAPVGRPGSGDPGQPAWTYQPAPSAPIFGITSCQGQNPLDVFREHARAREGYSTKVYRDALGNLTVGIGHRVTPEDDLDLDDEISPERVEEFWL